MRPLRYATILAMALVAVPMVMTPYSGASAQIGIGLSITLAPPELPVYVQPPLPAPGYLWTPGYWSYGDEGYYWVPGTWVEPPQPGLLWTPGYWGWNNGYYAFNRGYWGAQVGFYGGINYGFGYTGAGFFGGEWRGGVFAYNRAAVSNFGNVHVTNVYNRTIVNVHVTNVSFNGPHGIDARPTPQQEQFAHERHVDATAAQIQHVQAAQHNRDLLASVNHGRPAIAATARPGDFHAGVVPARSGADFHPAAGAMHPGMTENHGGMAPHGTMAPHNNMMPHTPATPHTEMAPHAMMAPRASAPEHEAMAPRPEMAPHAMTPRPMMAPHPAMAPAPHPAAAPHQAAPHHEEKPR